MSPLDIALVALLTAPGLLGVFKGLVNVAVALVGLWAAFVVAQLLHVRVAAPIESWLGSAPLAAVLAYGALFVSTLLVAGWLGWLVTRSLRKVGLQWADRLAGGLLGLACGALLAGLVVAGWRTAAPSSPALTSSVLAAPITRVTEFLTGLTPTKTAPGLEAAAPPEGS